MEEENKQTDEKKETDKGTEGKPDDTPEGVQSETNKTVDDINLAAKRSEEAAEKLKIENDRTENNYAKMKAGGQAQAGGEAPVKKTEEQAKKEGAMKFFKGTQLEQDIKNS